MQVAAGAALYAAALVAFNFLGLREKLTGTWIGASAGNGTNSGVESGDAQMAHMVGMIESVREQL
jgi:hypothetical protein